MSFHGRRILLIEHNKKTIDFVRSALDSYMMELIVKTDGEKGLKTAVSEKFDLILTEILLPAMDGLEICRRLKAYEVETPIIIITEKDDEVDKILGLELGADDFITKPFGSKELLARMKAVMRRLDSSIVPAKSEIVIEEIDLKIDVKNHYAFVSGQPLNLTPKEFDVLSYLCSHSKCVIDRKKFLKDVWGYYDSTSLRTVDEHIKKIRKKLFAAGIKEKIIETVWGVGYKFNPKCLNSKK